MPQHALITAAKRLSRRLAKLSFAAPVTHVYDPLTYAFDNHAAYIERFAAGKKHALFLGMNPGPWGMAQTGVPFGDACFVGGWLGIDRPVRRPAREHPKRPVLGLHCRRSEVSGTRLWGGVQAHFETPDRFIAEGWYIGNYCPLSFMAETGRNVTPDKLPKDEREPLYAICDEHLREMVSFLQPRHVIGIGAFAEKRAKVALEGHDDELTIGRVLHPSPASPKANKDWIGQVTAELTELGVCRHQGK